jgi:hypothetical protein
VGGRSAPGHLHAPAQLAVTARTDRRHTDEDEPVFHARCAEAVTELLDQHRHVFLHRTPTHASWLNQVELVFSILQRRLLRYGEFASVDDLAAKIIAFINDYNKRAKPSRSTYDGRPPQIA